MRLEHRIRCFDEYEYSWYCPSLQSMLATRWRSYTGSYRSRCTGTRCLVAISLEPMRRHRCHRNDYGYSSRCRWRCSRQSLSVTEKRPRITSVDELVRDASRWHKQRCSPISPFLFRNF
jgi:hypothetical protein